MITKPTLPNISRTKDNQAIEFDQLLKYNMGNGFLKTSCMNGGRNTSFRPLFGF